MQDACVDHVTKAFFTRPRSRANVGHAKVSFVPRVYLSSTVCPTGLACVAGEIFAGGLPSFSGVGAARG